MSESDETNQVQAAEPAAAPTFAFLRGGEDLFTSKGGVPFDWNGSAEVVREQLSEAMHSRNVSFLLGAGCSSYLADGKQVGIPTMQPLADEFVKGEPATDPKDGEAQLFLTGAQKEQLKNELGIDLLAEE